MQPRFRRHHSATRVIATTAILAMSATLPAQLSVASSGKAVRQKVFAAPNAITLAHVKAAMESGTIYTEQLRRTRTGTSVNSAGQTVSTYEGTFESMVYRSAVATNPEMFRLQLTGIEGKVLTAASLAVEQAKFLNTAGFKFRYQGFRVADSVAADSVYTLIYLTTTSRTTKQGIQKVYRVAVVPQKWDRNAFVLEIDTRTGYPLYVGEFSLKVATFTLESELIVTSYQTGVRVPSATDASWWRPIKSIELAKSPAAAAKKALSSSTKYAIPSASDLPTGFKLRRSEVLQDPYTGQRRALFTFSDGLSHVFVEQRNVKLVSRGEEDTIAVLSQGGLTQCQFKHGGVEFLVAGRSNGTAMHHASAELFARAVALIK